LRIKFLGTAALCVAAMTLVGCRQDMHDQPKYREYGYSEFFKDGRNSRPLVANTVARGQLHEDDAFYKGKNGTVDVDTFPVAVDKQLIERGRDRYNIFCSPCHGQIGNGLGMIVRRGFKQPPSYHIDRLRQAPVGHFYDVITNGYGAMLNYAQQIQPRDRWAIISYIRALQYSQNANVSELSAEQRAKLPSADKMQQPMVPHDPTLTDPERAPIQPGVPPVAPNKAAPGTVAPPARMGVAK
jgi:mono/diheme cytochrome c family protein